MKNFKIGSKIKVLFKLAICILCGLLISCEKFVEVELPNNQLTGTAVFKDINTANASVAHLYSLLRDQSLVSGSSAGIATLLGYYGDELVYYGASANPFYQNGLLANDFRVSTTWNEAYNLIYSANAVINGIESARNISEQDKIKLRGEATFMRAYIHFYLLNIFGAIPYVTSTDYNLNRLLPKLSVRDVYNSIIADLIIARNDLSDAYVTEERVRVNRSVASAMLARVYLYTENWDAALKAADQVINRSDLYTWVSDLNKVFLKNSTGTLWQLIPNNVGNNTPEASNFIFTSGPPPLTALRPELVNAFETGDLRRSNWIGTVTKGSESWYFSYKYKENKPTAASQEYSILFRLEEMYFIRAEANAKLNNLTLAAKDLNKIRNRAGLGDTPASTTPDLLAAILKERRVELFTERGHRWFDLKRSGQLNAALTGVKPGWDAKGILWPLPENELRLNPNLLPQNPGY